jgi:hypothetical protein
MADEKIFRTAKDLRAFIEKNCPDLSKIYVKEIYNPCENQYSVSPLFLYSGYSVIMAYLSEEGLSLKTYDKDFFIQHIRGGIFCESPDSDEIYHISFPHAKLINSFVQKIDVQESEDKAVARIDLAFKNGLHLCAEPSPSGKMNSYITD